MNKPVAVHRAACARFGARIGRPERALEVATRAQAAPGDSRGPLGARGIIPARLGRQEDAATALQCTQSTLATVDMPIGGAATVFSPACPPGYAKTSTSCDTTSTQAYLTISALGGCQARNTSGSIQQLSAQATCCRVPGR